MFNKMTHMSLLRLIKKIQYKLIWNNLDSIRLEFLSHLKLNQTERDLSFSLN